MNISILLPYKENFSPNYPGAVSIFLKDTINLSKFKKNILVFGNTNFEKKLLKSYKNLDFKKSFLKSSSKLYLNKFLEYEKENNSDLIEIHNRPDYINTLFDINDNLVLYFHNNPIDMKGSSSIEDRINIINKTKKIIFNSQWTKKKFIQGIKINNLIRQKLEIIYQSTNIKKVNFSKKKNYIIFVGRLNSSKGYDIFGNAVIKILEKYPDWEGIVIGDEPREKILFKHKRLHVLGFLEHNKVTNWFLKSQIAVVCSRWEEPFGRTALEATSSGCAVIISNRGGLPEAAPDALKINSLSVNSVEFSIEKLIKNKLFRSNLQKKSFNNFYLTNSLISKKIDNYRDKLIKFPVPDISKERRKGINNVIKFMGEKREISTINIRKEANDELKKFLIFRTDRIGDYIISRIFFNAIKQKNKRNVIDVVCSRYNQKYIKNYKDVNKTFVLDKYDFNSFFPNAKKINQFSYDTIIILDGKRRSFFFSIFLSAKEKFILLKDFRPFFLINLFSYRYFLNSEDKPQNSNFSNFLKSINLPSVKNFNYYDNYIFKKDCFINIKNFILIHLDEKWFENYYYHDFDYMNLNTDNFNFFLNKIIKKFNKKIIITTGSKKIYILMKIKKKFFNYKYNNIHHHKLFGNKVSFIENTDFRDLEILVKKSKLLISCEGAISHVSNGLDIPTIALIQKDRKQTALFWTQHMKKIYRVFRSDVFNLVKDIAKLKIKI